MTPNGLRPFFSYYGSKFRLAPHYAPPRYTTIYEPFAGSAGYALAYPDRRVVLIDKDPVIAGLWNYLIHVSPEEIMRLPAHVENVDDHAIPQEAKWLIGFWLNAATTAPCRTPSKWVRQAQAGDNWESQPSPGRTRVGYTPQAAKDRFWGEGKRALIASQVDKIRHWEVRHGSYADIPDEEATWFVDPPYRVMGAYYKMSAKQIDFAHLGEWCRSRSGQVIVCENAGAGWLPFRLFRDVKSNQARRGAKARNVEVIWTSDSAQRRFATTRPPPRAVAPGARLITSLR